MSEEETITWGEAEVDEESNDSFEEAEPEANEPEANEPEAEDDALDAYITKVIDSEIALIHKLPAHVAESEFVAAMAEEGKTVLKSQKGFCIS